MKKLIVILFLMILSSITYSQSGVGYLNYVSYYTHGGYGWTNQYPQFANSATDFDNMFNTANSNTTIYSQGVGPAATTLVVNGSYAGGVRRNNYWGVKVTGYFIPKESGTYYFGIDGDDGVDLSINGNVVTSFYGGHGFQGYRIGSVNLTAGTKYWSFDKTGRLTLPENGDIVDVNGTSVLGGGSPSLAEPSFEAKTSNFNAFTGHRYGVDTTSGAVVATLPSDPTVGDAIYFIDFGGMYSTNNLTIAGNNNTIMGQSEDLVVTVNNESFGLAYNGTTWRVY